MAYDGKEIENDNDDSSLGLMVFQEIEETKREDGGETGWNHRNLTSCGVGDVESFD